MSNDLVKRLRDKVEASRIYDDDEELLDEAADLIEQLETANLKQSLITVDHLSRIETLEAALKKIAQHDMQAIAMDALRPGERIRKALEGKDD